MMSLTQAFWYAAIQGVSEFLPISSSAHLALFQKLVTLTPPGALFETAVHLGSLLVLLTYFWADVLKLIKGFFHILRGRLTQEGRLFLTLLMATLPALCVGLLIEKTIGRQLFNNLEVIGWTTLIFGALLWAADLRPQRFIVRNITLRQAFWGWGIMQCLAFVHGVSRSGITITFGRFMRYKRTDAIRFAFLMAIPTLKGATVLKARAFLGLQTVEEVSLIFFAVLVSFVIGFCVIHLLMRSLNTALLRFLGLYRVLLGALILGGLYFWNWF